MSNNDSSDQAPWLTPKDPSQPSYGSSAADSGGQPPAYQPPVNQPPSNQPSPYQTPTYQAPNPQPPSYQAPSYSAPGQPYQGQANSPTPYGGNQYASPYATPATPLGYKPQSGLAIAALITSLVLWCIPFLEVVALVLGIVALNDTKNDVKSGRGMAIAGVVISAVVLVAWAVLFLLGVFAESSSSSYRNSYWWD